MLFFIYLNLPILLFLQVVATDFSIRKADFYTIKRQQLLFAADTKK